MSKKQTSEDKNEVEKKVVKEQFYTDILEEYFVEDGIEKKKQTFMNKDKFVKEEIVTV